MAAKASEPEEAQAQNLEDTTRKRQGNIQIVEFVLGKESFAIDLFDVKEVVEYTTITKLPNVPAYIKGIIDLRGEITTIIDLKHGSTLQTAARSRPNHPVSSYSITRLPGPNSEYLSMMLPRFQPLRQSRSTIPQLQ